MDKPREFWIVPENDTMWIQDALKYNPDHFADQDYFKKENPIHVIEYSAYEQLKKENEKLYAARKEFSRVDWRTFGALALENEQLKSNLKVAVEALNELNEDARLVHHREIAQKALKKIEGAK